MSPARTFATGSSEGESARAIRELVVVVELAVVEPPPQALTAVVADSITAAMKALVMKFLVGILFGSLCLLWLCRQPHGCHVQD